MITICPWGYPPNAITCPSCKHRSNCTLYRQPEEPVVLNGMAGVWRNNGTLILENSSGQRIDFLVEEIDAYVALLQAVQQELAA